MGMIHNKEGHAKNFAHICRESSAKRKSADDISRFPEPKHHAGRQVATAACGGLTLRVRFGALPSKGDGIDRHQMIFPSSRRRPQASAPNLRYQGWR